MFTLCNCVVTGQYLEQFQQASTDLQELCNSLLGKASLLERFYFIDRVDASNTMRQCVRRKSQAGRYRLDKTLQ